jgi:ribosomal protein S18 acetylase RimI-like enzyme
MLRTITAGPTGGGHHYYPVVLELREVPGDALEARRAEVVARAAPRHAASRFVDLDTARRQVEEILARNAATSAFLDVLEGSSVVGALWLGIDGEELVVHDAELDEPSRAADLVPVLAERARSRDARMVGVGVHPGEVTRAVIAGQPGFRVRATNMALRLDRPVGDPAPLALRPMSHEEYADFTAGEVEGFAEELAAAGMDRERALERSRTMMAELLPAGLGSPDMEFHTALVDGEVVGDLWLSTAEPMAFVYNIVVRPECRRRGHGARIMNAAALHCRDLGRTVLGLNVFAHNPGARALYDKLGYEVTHQYSALDLTDAG